MIAIIDYGMGNVGSICNMLTRLGVESRITSDPQVVASADRLILPGVGAFDAAMVNLRQLGLVDVLNEQVVSKAKPILGICLGMQLFTKASEEGVLPGLGWLDAETVKFRSDGPGQPLRIPHMGWNTLRATAEHPLLSELPSDSRFYFVHSYYVRCNSADNVLCETTYGLPFHSAVVKDHIVGTQFHPEKSHKYGLALLRNYVEATL